MKARRWTVTAAAIFATLAVAVPGAAARKHPGASGTNISINTSENPIVSGDPLLIWGKLSGGNVAGQRVFLYHRINPKPNFTLIQTTKTDANGFYSFERQAEVVNTNRNWYVLSQSGARSRTLHEKVFADVTFSGPPEGSTLLTGPAHKTMFTGTVAPFRVGDVVLLQRQSSDSSGNGWGTIDKTRVQSGGNFSFNHTFRVPGDASLRVLVKPTPRNIASVSDSIDYEISQTQNPNLTLTPSADPITFGDSVTLTGTLAGGAGKTITLLGKLVKGSMQQIATTTADGSGNFSFTQSPQHNMIYRVKGGGKSSAQVFEGVHDLLTASVSATSVNTGDPVTFSGTVTPDKTGHVIYLQRQNASGTGFHTVQVERVGAGSAYSITRRLWTAGTKVFRVLIPGGPGNEKAASPPFTITVNQTPVDSAPQQPDNTSEG